MRRTFVPSMYALKLPETSPDGILVLAACGAAFCRELGAGGNPREQNMDPCARKRRGRSVSMAGLWKAVPALLKGSRPGRFLMRQVHSLPWFWLESD